MRKRKQLQPPSPELVFPRSGPDGLEALPELILDLEAFCKDARALLVSAIREGVVIPGADIIPTNSPRRWVDGEPEERIRRTLSRALQALGKPGSLDDVAPRVLLSVAEVERRMGKVAFAREESLSRLVQDPLPTGNYSLRLKPKPKAK